MPDRNDMKASKAAKRAPKALTSRFVESITTEKDRIEVRDGKVDGLELRVTRSRTKTWVLRYKRHSDSKQQTLTLGHFSRDAPALEADTRPDPRRLLTLEGARTLAIRQRAVISTGRDPASDRAASKAAETFREVADEWLRLHAVPNKAARVVSDDRSMLERHVHPAIGGMKAAEIAKRDVRRMLDKVVASPDARSSGNSPTRKLTHRPNRVLSLVRAIFRWAVGRDMLTTDPTLGLPAPILREPERLRTLSSDEVRALWLALDKAPIAHQARKGLARGQAVIPEGAMPLNRAVALAAKLALATGQRIGEVAKISVGDLDLNDTAPMWIIPAPVAKNRRLNRVPLSPLSVRLVREALELAGEYPKWLFPRSLDGQPRTTQSIDKAFDRAQRRNAFSIADFNVHDLRRTAATQMAEMGVALETISLILNHQSARTGTVTGKHYSHPTTDPKKRKALDDWGARLERIAAGTEGSNVVSMVLGSEQGAEVLAISAARTPS